MSAVPEWAKSAAPINPCRTDVINDVDEIAVERACRGELPRRLTRAEMAEAFLRLDQSGLSARRISELLAVSPRTVVRWRGGHHFPCSTPRSANHGGWRQGGAA